MVELFITIAIVSYCFTKTIFAPPPAPPAPSLEKQLTETLAKYLGQGIKVKVEK